MSRQKKDTSPEFKKNKPKTSKIALKNEKRTDIFGINSNVSIWCRQQESNLHESPHRILSPACLPISPCRLHLMNIAFLVIYFNITLVYAVNVFNELY